MGTTMYHVIITEKSVGEEIFLMNSVNFHEAIDLFRGMEAHLDPSIWAVKLSKTETKLVRTILEEA